MREIKFRGKRVDNGEWVYGNLWNFSDNTTMINNIDKHYEGYEVIPETVGQYTELNDKNGKEIYEGDIIKNKNNIGYIDWNNEDTCYYVIFSKTNTKCWLGRINEILEKIGTIYDNKEMESDINE